MIPKIGVEFRHIPCGKLRRYFSLENFFDVFRVIRGVSAAKKILEEWKPDVVFSKGGYVSLPVVFAASRLKIPVVTHESDVSVGLANKLTMRFADTICLSFEETMGKLAKRFVKKAVVTGNPVRESVLAGDPDKGLAFTKVDDYRPVILVMGGSQGAAQINGLVRNNLDELLKRYQIVHLVGRGNIEMSLGKKGYIQYEFLNDEMADVYSIADMVVTRGGANALAEIALLGKKALVIPLSMDGSRGDQIENARVFAGKFGWSSLSGAFDSKDFVETLDMAFRNEVNEGVKFENGSGKIVDLILAAHGK